MHIIYKEPEGICTTLKPMSIIMRKKSIKRYRSINNRSEYTSIKHIKDFSYYKTPDAAFEIHSTIPCHKFTLRRNVNQIKTDHPKTKK